MYGTPFCTVHNERRDAFKAAIRALVADQAATDLAAKAAAPPPPFDADGDAAADAEADGLAPDAEADADTVGALVDAFVARARSLRQAAAVNAPAP